MSPLFLILLGAFALWLVVSGKAGKMVNAIRS